MQETPNRFGRSQRGVSTPFVLIALTVVIILTVVLINRDRPTGERPAFPSPQTSAQLDTRALYIAQTALDRSVKALATDPSWRDGFDTIPFEDGTYDVRVIEPGDPGDQSALPPNYVRIVATSEVDGVKSEVEAVWVDAMAAFRNTYTAGNHIELSSHDGTRTVILGSVHNNSWQDGHVVADDGVTVYGNLTSRGPVSLGTKDPNRTAVFGAVWGSRIEMSSTSLIQGYDELSEWNEGVDLNGDGDTDDLGLTTGDLHVSAATEFVVDGRTLSDGDMDLRIGNGATAVAVGGEPVGPIFDPRPVFAAYYELTSGSFVYPPRSGHVTTQIAGDGDGHYFAAAAGFLDWLSRQNHRDVPCWRCAGDARIDPGNATECPTCDGTGYEPAVEVSGVFYIDDAICDLSEIGTNLIVHGTIVVAKGDPYGWPEKIVASPSGDETIDHFPREGKILLRGPSRMNFTQTYRSSGDDRSYRWNKRILFAGENAQTIAIPEAVSQEQIRDFPALVAASEIVIEPRQRGFGYHPGDVGDEQLTILQGVVYAEDRVRLHSRGGWRGEEIVFDEELPRGDDESLDEPVLNLDLNGDGDTFDHVSLGSIKTVPVVPVSQSKYSVDINNDGILGSVSMGSDYSKFFSENGYMCPVLIYQQGLVLSESIHSCEQTLVVPDPGIVKTGVPFGFELTFGAASHRGVVSWTERSPSDSP